MKLLENQLRVLRKASLKGIGWENIYVVKKLERKGLVALSCGKFFTTEKGDKILRQKYGSENF